MLELPEVMNVSNQLKTIIISKRVKNVLSPTKLHKFCWFNGDPDNYANLINETTITNVIGFGLYVEIEFSNNYKLCFNDGINVRYENNDNIQNDFQLKIQFTDNTCLIFTVAMYGGILLHDNNFINDYYLKSKNSISPTSSKFKNYFYTTIKNSNPKLSAKAFLATEQRFPGIGNGSTQDILFNSGINPKQKLSDFTDNDKEKLLISIVTTMKNMIDLGGRDTEKDIFGNFGKYKTKLSKNTYSHGCPNCGNPIIKEQYLGGSIYYCPTCQPINNYKK